MADIKPIETVYNGLKFRSRLEARWAVFFDSLGVKYEYEPEGFELNGIKYLPDFKIKCYGTRGFDINGQFDLYIEVKGEMNEKDAYKLKKIGRHSEFQKCPYGYEFNGLYPSPRDDFDDHERRWMCDCGATFGKCMDDDGHLLDAPRKFICHGYSIFETKEIEMQNEPFFYGIPILIVGAIPHIECERDCFDSDLFESYNNFGFDTYKFNYELIDGDHFAAYPSVNNNRFYLMGDDLSYIDCTEFKKLIGAYKNARQARFEHGEHPITERRF